MPGKLLDLPQLMSRVNPSLENCVVVGCYNDCADGSDCGCAYCSKTYFYQYDDVDECFDDLTKNLYDWYVNVCKETNKIFKRECRVENNVLWLLEGGDQDIAIIFQSNSLAKKFRQKLKSIILPT